MGMFEMKQSQDSHQRSRHLIRFYSLLDILERNLGGTRTLAESNGHMPWPTRGVYFFQEPGEVRIDTGSGPRIVRVGTHALKAGSKAKLWKRLSQHKGQVSDGGGNHRGSIFRLIVGTALLQRHGRVAATWGKGDTAARDLRDAELTMECEVTGIIGKMPFLWLPVDDPAGPESRRDSIERNSIALLSNYDRPPLDAPSNTWLGGDCNREKVRMSGLWNSNYVEKSYNPEFLDEFETLVSSTKAAG